MLTDTIDRIIKEEDVEDIEDEVEVVVAVDVQIE